MLRRALFNVSKVTGVFANTAGLFIPKPVLRYIWGATYFGILIWLAAAKLIPLPFEMNSEVLEYAPPIALLLVLLSIVGIIVAWLVCEEEIRVAVITHPPGEKVPFPDLRDEALSAAFLLLVLTPLILLNIGQFFGLNPGGPDKTCSSFKFDLFSDSAPKDDQPAFCIEGDRQRLINWAGFAVWPAIQTIPIMDAAEEFSPETIREPETNEKLRILRASVRATFGFVFFTVLLGGLRSAQRRMDEVILRLAQGPDDAINMGEQIIPRLIKVMLKKDMLPKVREHAAQALGGLHAEAGVGALGATLFQKDWKVAKAAAEALGQIQTETSYETLAVAVKMLLSDGVSNAWTTRMEAILGSLKTWSARIDRQLIQRVLEDGRTGVGAKAQAEALLAI